MHATEIEGRSPSELDAVFGALSHGVRRSLLARLGEGPATIGELAAPYAMSLPAVSKHVRVLERAGLVARSVEGRVHRCALDARPLADAQAWLDRYRVFWSGSLDSLAAFVESEGES
ncbi:MAG: ArsR/SmtB family transcription factor [Sandaracinaceae bacterium]